MSVEFQSAGLVTYSSPECGFRVVKSDLSFFVIDTYDSGLYVKVRSTSTSIWSMSLTVTSLLKQASKVLCETVADPDAFYTQR